MNQTSIEESILGTADQLEDTTRELGDLTDQAQEAENAYKRKHAMTMLSLQD